MSLRPLPSMLKWLAVLVVLGLLLASAYTVNTLMRSQHAAEAKEDTVRRPKRAENGVVKLGAELAESHEIKDEPAQATSWSRQVPAYGRVVSNPQATAEVRSPFAGTLQADPN